MITPTRAASALLLALSLASCVPWTVRPIQTAQQNQPGGSVSTDPAAYVDSIWASKLLPAVINSAVDARLLLNALASSPEQACARYGRREANGPCHFLVKGSGRVTAVDTRSRAGLALVDIPPFDQQPDLSIQIGPVLRGASLRDATGLVPFSAFVNQLQFADAGNEINARVLNTVLAGLDRVRLQGRLVSFAGALSVHEPSGPPLAGLVPVLLTIEERH